MPIGKRFLASLNPPLPMSDQLPANDLRTSITKWQQKYGIADGDPALACLELFDLYVLSLRDRKPDSPPLRFEEFRSTMEFLDQRSKGFAKHASELIQELRQTTQTLNGFRQSAMTAWMIAAIASLASGFLIGHFLW